MHIFVKVFTLFANIQVIQIFPMSSCKLLKYHVLDILQVTSFVLHEAWHERDKSRFLRVFNGYFLNYIRESLY